MGFSPGDFKVSTGRSLHWEGKASSIVLWNNDESMVLVDLIDIKEARKAADQLMLLVEMAEADAL